MTTQKGSSVGGMRSILKKNLQQHKGAWDKAKDAVNPFGELPLPDGQYIGRIEGGDVKEIPSDGKSEGYVKVTFKIAFICTVGYEPFIHKLGDPENQVRIDQCRAQSSIGLRDTANRSYQDALANLKYVIELFLEPSKISESDDDFDPSRHIITFDQSIPYLFLLKPLCNLTVRRGGGFTNVDIKASVGDDQIPLIEQGVGYTIDLVDEDVVAAAIGITLDEQGEEQEHDHDEEPPFETDVEGDRELEEELDVETEVDNRINLTPILEDRTKLKDILKSCHGYDAETHKVFKSTTNQQLAAWCVDLEPQTYKMDEDDGRPPRK